MTRQKAGRPVIVVGGEPGTTNTPLVLSVVRAPVTLIGASLEREKAFGLYRCKGSALAIVTLCDTMPGAVGERLGPQPEAWLPPSADFTVHVLDDARAEWILGVNRARHAGDGYASVDMELWDMEAAEPKLVAYGTQMMFFSFPKE